MKTICTCGRKATCNCRKVNGRFVFEGEQVAIDLENDVQYVSMCPQCYFREARAFYAALRGSNKLVYKAAVSNDTAAFFLFPATQQRKICCCRCFFTPQKGEEAPISTPADRCRMPASRN